MIDHFHQLTLKIAIDIQTRFILCNISMVSLTIALLLPDSILENWLTFIGVLFLGVLTGCSTMHCEMYKHIFYRLYVICLWISIITFFINQQISNISFTVSFVFFIIWVINRNNGGGGTKIKDLFSAAFGSTPAMNPV